MGGEGGREGGGQDGVEWGGKWDNCNSIINKYILKKRINRKHCAQEKMNHQIWFKVTRETKQSANAASAASQAMVACKCKVISSPRDNRKAEIEADIWGSGFK